MFNEDFLIKIAANLLGMPPEKAREHLMRLQEWNVQAITGFDARIKRLESNQAEIIRLLKLLNGETENVDAANGNRIEFVANGSGDASH